jgi:hypothetical protein
MQVSFESGVLETVQLTLQTYFELRMRDGNMNHVTKIFEADNPAAAKIAKSFYENKYLEKCIEAKLPFGEVFDQILILWNKSIL